MATLAIILWVVTILGYGMFNLYQKNVKLENIVISQASYIDSIRNIIGESDKVMRELDSKIWMDSDRELAAVFQNLKAIQEVLNQYKKS